MESKDQRNFRYVGVCGREEERRLGRWGRQSHVGEDTLNARLRGVGNEEPEEGLEEMSGRLVW